MRSIATLLRLGAILLLMLALGRPPLRSHHIEDSQTRGGPWDRGLDLRFPPDRSRDVMPLLRRDVRLILQRDLIRLRQKFLVLVVLQRYPRRLLRRGGQLGGLVTLMPLFQKNKSRRRMRRSHRRRRGRPLLSGPRRGRGGQARVTDVSCYNRTNHHPCQLGRWICTLSRRSRDG
jgi:hypothetical protein